MTVKSIIDIQVNDGAFQRFNAVFQQYQKHLSATPIAWRNIAQAQGKSTDAFKDLVALEVQSMGHQKMMLQVQQAASRMTRTTADAWRDMARNTKSVAGDIRDATSQLLKWTSLTGVFSGVIGAGGLFGVNRMSAGVAAGRQSSMGLGVGYGEQTAFQNAFSRLGNPDAVLSGVNGALTDVSKRSALYGAGFKENELGGGAAQVSARLFGKLKTLADQTPDQLLGTVFSSRHIGDLGVSSETFQMLKRMSRGELSDLNNRFSRNTGAFGVGSRDQLAYQNFATTLDAAGDKLNAVFVRGLAPLIPGLEKLSTATVNAVKAFLEAPALKDWIKGASDGLQAFAVQVQRPEFKQGVESFVTGVSDFIGSFNSFAAFVKNPLAGPPKGQDFTARASQAILGGHTIRDIPGAVANVWNRGFGGGDTFADRWGALAGGGRGGLPMKSGAGYRDPGLAALADRIYRDIPGIKRGTAFNDAYHDGRGAHGANRAFDMTLDDPSQSGVIAARVRAELARMGIAGKVIDEYKNPSAHATGGHLHVETNKHVDVRVLNAAGSSVIVQSSQLSAGGFPQ